MLLTVSCGMCTDAIRGGGHGAREFVFLLFKKNDFFSPLSLPFLKRERDITHRTTAKLSADPPTCIPPTNTSPPTNMHPVHARALELKQESDVSAVIELHSSDQTLVGKALRGCGVVFCEKGRELFASAVTTVQDAMSVSNCDTI